MNLKGKVAIVTGGGTGIGFGISSVLSSHGASIAIAQIDTGNAESVLARLDSSELLVCQVDVADRVQVEQMVDLTVQRFGRIDILVNNAAITGKSATSAFLDSPQPLVDRIIGVNLKGVFHCSQAVARYMIGAGIRGSIVHISSVGAYTAQEHASVYCATKAAVSSLAQSMALELAEYGIRVNSVAPGGYSHRNQSSHPRRPEGRRRKREIPEGDSPGSARVTRRNRTCGRISGLPRSVFCNGRVIAR